MVKEVSFEDIPILSSGSHFVQLRGTVCANLVEHFCEIKLNLSQRLSRKCHIKIFLTLVAILSSRAKRFVQ